MEKQTYEIGKIYTIDEVPEDIRHQMKRLNYSSAKFERNEYNSCRKLDGQSSFWLLSDNSRIFGESVLVKERMEKDDSNTEFIDIKLGIKVRAWDYNSKKHYLGTLIAKRIKHGTTIDCWEHINSAHKLMGDDKYFFVTERDGDKKHLWTQDVQIVDDAFSIPPEQKNKFSIGKLYKFKTLPEESRKHINLNPETILTFAGNFKVNNSIYSMWFEGQVNYSLINVPSDSEVIEIPEGTRLITYLYENMKKHIIPIRNVETAVEDGMNFEPESVKNKEIEVPKPNLKYKVGDQILFVSPLIAGCQIPQYGEIIGKLENSQWDYEVKVGEDRYPVSEKDIIIEPRLSPEEFSRAKEFIQTGEIKDKFKKEWNDFYKSHCKLEFKPLTATYTRQQTINEIFDCMGLKCIWNSRWSGEVREFLQEVAKEFNYKTPDER